jgi:DNA integrity scanning protein DisA with diadenylate cyclase activity
MFATNQTTTAGRDMGRTVEQDQLVNAIFESRRDIAVIQNEQKNIIARFDKQEASAAEQKATLDEVKRMLDQASGGWRVLMMVGGMAATVGGVISWVISHVTFK